MLGVHGFVAASEPEFRGAATKYYRRLGKGGDEAEDYAIQPPSRTMRGLGFIFRPWNVNGAIVSLENSFHDEIHATNRSGTVGCTLSDHTFQSTVEYLGEHRSAC